jgi:pre-mRNA-processing factor 17
MDSNIKIWDVHGNRKCLRTFMGHSEGVRDINFTNDGAHFVSASYDRYIKYWDTETGQCISRHTSKKVPFCSVFHPTHDQEVLVGQSNKKIAQVYHTPLYCFPFLLPHIPSHIFIILI